MSSFECATGLSPRLGRFDFTVQQIWYPRIVTVSKANVAQIFLAENLERKISATQGSFTAPLTPNQFIIEYCPCSRNMITLFMTVTVHLPPYSYIFSRPKSAIFSQMVNVPKERRTFCKGKKCTKHTVHKVTQYKSGKASNFAQVWIRAALHPYTDDLVSRTRRLLFEAISATLGIDLWWYSETLNGMSIESWTLEKFENAQSFIHFQAESLTTSSYNTCLEAFSSRVGSIRISPREIKVWRNQTQLA